MHQDLAKELLQVVDAASSRLRSLEGPRVRRKPSPEKWSVQENLGHLVDSATNNHHRFVRALESDTLIFPAYQQDHWVRRQAYNEVSWAELIDLWRLSNRHLAHLISRIPENRMDTECRIGPNAPVTLGFLITDYLVHLRHHLRQIEDRLSAAPGALTLSESRADVTS